MIFLHARASYRAMLNTDVQCNISVNKIRLQKTTLNIAHNYCSVIYWQQLRNKIRHCSRVKVLSIQCTPFRPSKEIIIIE